MKIRKAVLPVAGLGTRFLPVTKAQPKEMLPIVDTPIIQLLVEELVKSGIDEIIMITGKGKRAIEDHFDYSHELESILLSKKKFDTLSSIENISNMAKIAYIRQPKPLGNGQAILLAKEFIGNEPFVILFGDEIIDADIPITKKMIDIFNKHKKSVLAVYNVPKEEVSNYGIIEYNKISKNVYEVKNIIEKPSVYEAPSTLASVGKYIVTPDIFDILQEIQPSIRTGEIDLTDALKVMAQNKKLLALEFDEPRYDTGSKLGWIQANIDFALKDKALSDKLYKFLKSKINKNG